MKSPIKICKLFFLFNLLSFPSWSQIVINEISQGPSGSKEYIEFLVLGAPCTSSCLDLRLWVFDDNNGFLNGGPTTGVGIAAGACRFADDVFWSCIPSGTLITIYNDADPNPSLPSDDVLMSDNNCNLVIPISSTLFDHHPSQPNSTNSTYPTTGWIGGGDWIDISMANSQDGFQIYNPADLVTPVFSVGWGTANVNGDIWMGAGSATDDVFYADNTIDCDFTLQGNWAQGCAGDIGACGSDDQTPGAPNSVDNAACITSFNNGCTGAPPLVIDSIPGTNIGCFGICDGSATAYVSGGLTPYTYLWSDPSGQTDSFATGLCAGTFIVTVTEAGGCQDTLDSVVITEPPLITSAITASTNLVCFGECIGTATVLAGGGTPPYTYVWNDPGNQTNTQATGLCAGTFDVVVTDVNGCDDTSTVIITQPTALLLTPDSVDATCGNNDGQAMVSVSGGTAPYTYQWDDSGTQTTDTAFALGVGNYEVVVTDFAGCSDSVTVTVVSVGGPPIFIDSIAGQNISCFGLCDGLATVYPSGGTSPYTYFWNDPGTQTTVTATGLCAGTFTITVSDASGCQDTLDSVVITQPPLITSAITASTNPLCFGNCNGTATVTVGGGTPPYTYAWNDPGNQTNAQATGLCAGAYDVVVTDINGCDDTSTVIITEPPLITSAITASTNPLCFGDCTGTATVTPGGGTLPYTYAWNDLGNQTNAQAIGLCAGTYDVIVTDVNGCDDTSTVIITQPPLITSAITASTNLVCFGECTGTATVTPGGGTPAYTYVWNDSGSQTNAIATGLCAGTYDVVVTDVNGCDDTSTVIITQPTALVLTGSGVDATCGNSDGQASVVVSGGTPPYSYQWDDSGTQTTDTAFALGAGIYTIVVTDLAGCVDSILIAVNDAGAPSATIISSINNPCAGDSVGSATVSVIGGATPYTYTWNDPNSQTTTIATGLPAGSYSATIIDSLGCIASAIVSITEPAVLVVNVSAGSILCNGDCNGSANTSVTGGTFPFTYAWNTIPIQTDSVATGLCAGSYNVTVTDANGCIAINSTFISQPAIFVCVLNALPVSCYGGTDGSICASASGGTFPYTYIWCTAFIGACNVGLPAMSCCVTVTDGNGCSLVLCDTVTQPSLLLIDSLNAVGSFTNESCPGSCDGTAFGTVSGGTSPYNYLWNTTPVQTTSLSTGLCAGNYVLTISDSMNCNASDSVIINSDAPPIINAGNDTTICQGACVTLNATGGIQYTWSPGIGLNDSTIANPIACPSVTTTYVVTGVDTGSNMILNGNFEQGNTGFSSSYGFGSASPGFYYVDPDPSIYNAGHSGSDHTSGSGNFLIVDGATTSNTNVWCQTVTVTPNTDYSFSAWLNNIIITSNNFTDPTLQFTVNGSPLCASLTLPELPDVWVEIACNWNSGVNTSVTICLYSLSTAGVGNDFGVDDISFTGPGTCANTDAVTIFVSPGIIINATATDETCEASCDGTVLASVSGGVTPFTFIWNNGAGFDSTGSALCDNTYTVVVTDSIGCSSTANTTVNAPPLLTLITVSIDASCGNPDGSASVTAAGGTGAYTYLWDDINNQTSATATGLPAGGYTVNVTDSNNCTSAATIPVNDGGAPVATITSSINVLCNGNSTGAATVAAVGGTTPYTYVWDDPMNQTTSTANGLAASTYVATVIDSLGCVSNAVIVITEPSALVLSTGTQTSTCGLANGWAFVTVIGGTSPYAYNWNDSSSQTNDTAQTLLAGNYTVIVTDSFNCSDSATVAVADVPGVVIQSLINTDVSCNGLADGQATVSVSGGSTPYSFQWDAGAGSQTDSTAIDLWPGIYSVTITDNAGCMDSGTVSITEPQVLVLVTGGVDANCGLSDGQVSVTVTGGTTPYTYLWDDSQNQTTSTAINLLAGTHAVVVVDSNGCSSGAAVAINDIPGGIAQIVATTDPSCFSYCDGSMQASMSGGITPFSYSWSDGQTTSTATGLCAGSYSVIVTDAQGCTSAINGSVTQPGPVLIQGSGSPASCPGASDGTATVNPLGSIIPYSYLWDLSTGAQTSASVDSLLPGTYFVTVTDGNGCMDSLSYNVVLDSLSPTAYFSMSDDTVSLLTSTIDFTNLSSPNLNSLIFQWDFGDGTTDSSTHTLHTYEDTGTYPVQLIATNSSGCADTIMLFVTIEGEYIIFIPNTFTPNGDGVNDYFFPKGVGIDNSNFRFYIFDRWGDQIFVSNDINQYWDGRANKGSRIAQEDVYIWLIIATAASSGEHHQYVGHVTLIR